MPLGLVVAGANRADMKLVRATRESLPVTRPRVTKKRPHPLCLDAGYDYPEIHELVAAWGFTAHIRPRRADPDLPPRIPGYRARRWVVERTPRWMNRFRRLLIRREKKVENYVAMLHFACAWITFRAADVFG
jgi:putative transposase